MIYFETELKARSYECDLYGHVNNAAFLNYCEFARVEFLESIGYNLQGLQKEGFLLPIIKIEIEYKAPVFAGDNLIVSVKWIRRGKSSAVFEQKIIKKDDNKLAAKVTVTWVVTDLQGKPISLPQELLDRVSDMFGELPPKNYNNQRK